MKRKLACRFAAKFGFLALVGLIADSAPSDIAEKKTEFGTGIKVGFSLAQYHDTCVMFRAYFISGDFFAGLHRTKQQSVFKKGSQTYSTFPDRLILNVEASTYSCSNPGDRPFDLGAGLMDNLNFEVSRKRGPDFDALNILSTQTRHKSHMPRWDYFFEIPTANIPLSDEFLVDIHMRENAGHARMYAQLN